MANRSFGIKRKRRSTKCSSLASENVRTEYTVDQMPPSVAAWYKSALAKGVAGVLEEFRQIRTYTPPNATFNAFNLNSTKNRYRDIMCSDAARVILRPLGSANEDYIHANYVNGSKCTNQFICTQGPLDSTVPDFWRMVWQERVSGIIMLCEVVEKQKQKCAQYWPLVNGQSATYGQFTVKNTSSKLEELSSTNKAKITVLEVTCAAEPFATPWIVIHCHWAEWPDRGVPPDSKTLIVLRSRMTQRGFPIVVHCSAGIGRTGTLTAIDQLLGPLEQDPCTTVEVGDTVKKIRDQRMHSVQNEQQYVYIYRVIIDYISMRWCLQPANTPGLKDFWSKHQALQQAAR